MRTAGHDSAPSRSPDPAALAAAVRAAARAAGYEACGITTAEPFPEYAAAVDALGRAFPRTAPLYAPFRDRTDPRRGAPWAQALVVAVRRYSKYRLPPGPAGHIGRNYLCDRRLPACPDHAMTARLTAALRALGLRVKRGSGTSDRWAAARAGVARLGLNTFALTPASGSWINIECWRVNAALPPDPPTLDPPCPPGCRRCIEACPTGALRAPRVLRMDRCVAWLTYHAPWPVAPSLWRRMGPWIYGCDACQDACPLNRGVWTESEPAPWLEAVAALLRPEALAELTDADYRRKIHPLFWYIPEDGVERWRANARRALAYAAARGRGKPTTDGA